jgi:hypothetical protein
VIPETVLAGSRRAEVARDKEDELGNEVTAGANIVMPFGGGPLDMTGLPVVAFSRLVDELLAKLIEVLEIETRVVCFDIVGEDSADVVWADPSADFDSAESFPRSGLGQRSFTPAEESLDPRRVETYPGEHSKVRPSKVVVTPAVHSAEQPLSKSVSEQFGMIDRYALLQAAGSDEGGAESPSSPRLTARAPDSNEERTKIADLCLNPILMTSQPQLWCN